MENYQNFRKILIIHKITKNSENNPKVKNVQNIQKNTQGNLEKSEDQKKSKSPHIILADKFKRYSKFRKNILRTLKKKIPKDLVRIGKTTFSNYV